MSTSYMVRGLLERYIKDLGLELIGVEGSEDEFRIIKYVRNAVTDILFQGSLDRCSDFVRGIFRGKELSVETLKGFGFKQ